MVDNGPQVLWQPDPDQVATSQLAAFMRWLATHTGRDFTTYGELWSWSVADIGGFWSSVAEFFDVPFHDAPRTVLALDVMPGAQWFPGATLNYAEIALREGKGKAHGDIAVVFHREDGMVERLTYGQLRDLVARCRSGLIRLGVRRGDRVVALVPNSPQALVALLATASLGAVWSSCSPDFGTRAVLDRFAQVEPTVLVAVDGYMYNGKPFDIRPTVRQIRGEVSSLRGVVTIPYLAGMEVGRAEYSWDDLIAESGQELEFEPVQFDHPLWILYSSGTTGLPKAIVHGHGGIVLEHLKALGLNSDIGPDDRFFWFTTTGWMMWNYLISGLLVGATIELYDGSPAHPDLGALWKLAQDEQITYFGTSAPYIRACRKAGLTPRHRFDLGSVRTVGSTGAPLAPEEFRWVADAVGKDVQVASVSGGTDLCTAFLGTAPNVPVWVGELSCRMLGARIAAYDVNGRDVVDDVGELVITKPMPSMPVSFWNDPGGARLRHAYFSDFPGVWRHGDWIRITPRGSAVIYGRSDSTLNRGGVRMGTSEFYRVVEGVRGVSDALVVDTTSADQAEGTLLLFVVLDGVTLETVQLTIRQELRTQLSPRHVPDRIVAIPTVPRTLNGKKCEVPVKKILSGVSPDQAVSREALQDPAALDPFLDLARSLVPPEAG